MKNDKVNNYCLLMAISCDVWVKQLNNAYFYCTVFKIKAINNGYDT